MALASSKQLVQRWPTSRSGIKCESYSPSTPFRYLTLACSFFQGRYGYDDETTFQEKAIVQTDIISKIPDNITEDQASTIPAGALAALFGLFQKTGIEFPTNGPTAIGKGVLILGGSSSVGQFGVYSFRVFNSCYSSALNFIKLFS
jgi:hypothetical protein